MYGTKWDKNILQSWLKKKLIYLSIHFMWEDFTIFANWSKMLDFDQRKKAIIQNSDVFSNSWQLQCCHYLHFKQNSHNILCSDVFMNTSMNLGEFLIGVARSICEWELKKSMNFYFIWYSFLIFNDTNEWNIAILSTISFQYE